MSDIMLGLEIMLIGMGLLFMSMVLFIAVSEALKRGLKSKNDGTSANSAKDDLPLTGTSTILENMSEEEMAASIVAVVATYESEKEDASSKRRNDLKKTYQVTVGAKTFVVEVEKVEGGGISVTPTSEVAVVTAQAASEPGQGALIKEIEHGTVGDKGTVKAPVRGVVISVNCRAGDHVKAGDVLCTLEAMKMENEILSSKSGTVKIVHVVPGKAVETNEVLLVIDESEGS